MTSNFRLCYKLQYIEEANNMCTLRMMLQLFPPKFASHQLNCKHHFMIILKGSVHGSACSFKADAFFSTELCILLLVIFVFVFILIYACKCCRHGMGTILALQQQHQNQQFYVRLLYNQHSSSSRDVREEGTSFSDTKHVRKSCDMRGGIIFHFQPTWLYENGK